MQPIIVRKDRNSSTLPVRFVVRSETVWFGKERKEMIRNVSKKRLTTEKSCDKILGQLELRYARVVELVDSLDSGSSAHSGHAGSSPASRTMKTPEIVRFRVFF